MAIITAEGGFSSKEESTKAAGRKGSKSTGRTSRSKKTRGTERGSPGKKNVRSKSGSAHTDRTGSKQEKLIGMLRRADGATIEEMAKAFSWQTHTVRGAIAGALKKKLGLNVTSEKVEGRRRVYRIAD